MASLSDKIKALSSTSVVTDPMIAEPAVANVMTLDEPIVGYDGLAYSGEETWILNESYKNTKNNSHGYKYEDADFSYIDEKKTVTINPNQINLTQEDSSQYIPFEMFRYYDGIDLMHTSMRMSIYFVNEQGASGESDPINVEYSDTKIRFGFLVSKEATALKGKLKLEIHVKGNNPFGGNYLLKTRPNDEIVILESLHGNGKVIVDEEWSTNVIEDVRDAANQAKAANAQAQEALASIDDKIADVSGTIAGNVKNELETTTLKNYYTKTETYSKAEVDKKIEDIDISEELKSYALKTELPTKVSELENDKGYLTEHQSLDAYALKDDLNGLASEQFVKDEVAKVDVSEQLKAYAKIENVYDKDTVDDKLTNVKVDLTGYAKETYVTGITDELQKDINTNKSNIQTANTAITIINETLDSIDKSPRVTYDATYGDVELDDGSTAEYMFTLWKTENGERTPQDRFQILGGGGGTGSSVTMKIAYADGYPQSIIKTVNEDVLIQYIFEGLDSAGDYVGGTASWKIGGKVVFSEEIVSGTNQVDLTKYMGIGDNKILLTVTHATGAIATKAWTVKIVDVRLESTFNAERNYPVGSGVEFTFIPYGSVDKTVHFILDGTEIGTKVSKASAAGLSDSYILPAQAHGSHLLEAYMTSDIANSNHIYTDIIWFDEEAEDPVIGCSTPELTMMQYDSVDITFTVFDPKTETPTVIIEDNGEVLNTLNNLEKNTNVYTYAAMDTGVHEITFVCGNTRKQIVVTVEELDINITPITASLAFDFNPVGYSNSSENRLWSYESDIEGTTIAMSVSDNFDWINGGYQSDKDGSYFCIKAGTTATINYKMFCASKNIKEQGGNYKLVFKTMNVQDASKPFMQCYKDNIGVIMQPHETNFHAGSGNSLYLAYSENDTIEFELNMGEVIQNSDDKMVMGYEDGVATKPLVYTSGATFVQGIQDDDAEYITLGSTSCDLYIYRFKAYRKALTSKEVLNNFITDARSASEMLKRYNRNQIYNEAVNDLNVSTGYSEAFIEHFAQQCPDLRVILLSAPTFTTSKDVKIQNTVVRQIYTNGREVDNWTVYNIAHSGQGTSSNLYGASGRNLDLIMNKKNKQQDSSWIEFGDGSTLSGRDVKLNLTKTSVPINYLNIKLNIASSENANNALLARRYNQYNPYKRPLVREEGYDYEVKDTMEFYNCVVFVQETDTTQDADGNYISHIEFNDCNWHYYGLGNIGDSKKTDDTRMNDPNDVNEFVVEIADNNLPNSKFQSGTYDEKGYSVTGAAIKAEWQTYKDDTYEMDGKYTVVTNTEKTHYLINENLPILYELIDGNYVLTSDEEIDLTKTYYEKNYPNAAYANMYKDKYAYNVEESKTSLESGWGISFECRYEHDDSDHEEHRRIWNEFYEWVIFSSDKEFYENLSNYCVLNSVMYYYLFTLRYTMIDNRAKNSFWHYGKCEDGKYRWDLSFGYDMDTALGIDNFGKQVFRYGYEDFDYVDADVEVDDNEVDENGRLWVFNAATSTFYNRLRLLFAQELRNLYNDLDIKGAWSAEDLITQFDASQSQFPEEVWRQDIIRKYIRPYTVSHINGKPDDTFLKEKMNGRKKYHRREFERNQHVYMASKFRTEDAKGNIIRLRAKDPTGNLAVPVNLDLTITPYMYLYVSVDYANGVITKQFRGEPGVPITIDYPLENGDIIAIESAPYLQSIGDISGLYTQEATLTTATRLIEVLLGNSTPGYANTYLQNVTMVKDGLIETINIENIPSLDDELDVSTLRKLKTLLAKGSGIKGLILAKNGAAETLRLPDLSILSMKNLTYLKDIDFDSCNNLDRLIIEDCRFDTLDSFVINGQTYENANELTIINNAPNLKRVRLTNVDWKLDDTSVLARLYDSSIGGYNANGGETTRAYLSGKVHVPVIKERDFYLYNELWSDLEITYTTFIPQFAATFVNTDGSILDVQYIDKGYMPVDPTTRIENPIVTPVQEPTVDKVFTFTGWDKEFVAMHEPMTFTAVYSSSTREYTIKYVSEFEGNPLQITTAPYGSIVEYEHDIPTYTALEGQSGGYRYYLFSRWDQSGYVNGDKTINAVFDHCDYTGSGYFEGREFNDLRPVEKYMMLKLNASGDIDISKYVGVLDELTFEMGEDYDFDEIESKILIKNGTYLDTETRAVFTGSNYIDTGIQLMSEDRSFVLAVDFEFNTGNSTDATLMECYDANQSEGFKLVYNGTGSFKWSSNITPVSDVSNREMLVIRHVEGESDIHVYKSNFAGDYVEYTLVANGSRDYFTPITRNLVFGCSINLMGKPVSYASGAIHWAKVWYGDLGHNICADIAKFTKEQISTQMCGYDRKILVDGSGYGALSFLATHVLRHKSAMIDSGGTSGGWGVTVAKQWLNTRFYNGLPLWVKQLIKPVKVEYLIGGGSTATNSCDCYVFLPSATSLKNEIPYSSEPYTNEEKAIYGDKCISYMTSPEDRVRTNHLGEAVEYWTRSVYVNNQTYFAKVVPLRANGDIYAFTTSGTELSLVIEFCM